MKHPHGMVQKGLILLMSNDHIKAVIELLGCLELALILGCAVSQDVEIGPEGVDLVGWVRGQVGSLNIERDALDRHIGNHFLYHSLVTVFHWHFALKFNS